MKGEELREQRNSLDFTQAQLADVLGVKSNTVARWERDVLAIPLSIELAMEEVLRRYKPKATKKASAKKSGKK